MNKPTQIYLLAVGNYLLAIAHGELFVDRPEMARKRAGQIIPDGKKNAETGVGIAFVCCKLFGLEMARKPPGNGPAIARKWPGNGPETNKSEEPDEINRTRENRAFLNLGFALATLLLFV